MARITDVATFSSAKYEETVTRMRERREEVHAPAKRVWAETGDVDKSVNIKGQKRVSRNSMRPNGEGQFVLENGIAVPVKTEFDGTASMGENVEKCFYELGTTFDMLGFLRSRANVQMASAIVQDVDDSYPVAQMTQFESDNRIAEQLRLLLSANNGGDAIEDYDLGLLYTMLAVEADIYDHYGLKGYYMVVGDQRGRGLVDPRTAQHHLGHSIQSPLRTSEIARQLKERWHLYYLQVERGGQPATRDSSSKWWEEVIGMNNVVYVPHQDLIAETQAGLIYLLENANVSQTELVEMLIDSTSGTNEPISHSNAQRIWQALRHVDIGAQTRLPNFSILPQPGDVFAHFRHAWPIDHAKAGENVTPIGDGDTGSPKTTTSRINWGKW